MSTILRESRLIDSCPPSISYDHQVHAASGAFDQEMYAIQDDTGQVVMIPNIMNLTDPKLIDALAWQFHVDSYDATRSLDFRKNLVQMSIIWHRTKGTVALIQSVIDLYWSGGATLQEWFQYKMLPLPNYPDTGWHDRYMFRILINEEAISPDDEAEVIDLINRYKPVSRWLEAVVHSKISSGTCYFAGYVQFYTYYRSAAAYIR